MLTTKIERLKSKQKRLCRVKCKQCGREYEKTNYYPGFCSDECKRKSLTTTCDNCGKAYTKKTFRTNIRNLCPDCKPKKEKPTEKRQCIACGKEFIAKHGHQKYCSPACWGKPQAKTLYDRVCVTCGTAFKSKWETTRFCSDPCKDHPVEKECVQCGSQFVTTKEKEHLTKYCSDQCRKAAKRTQDRKAKAKWKSKQPKVLVRKVRKRKDEGKQPWKRWSMTKASQ